MVPKFPITVTHLQGEDGDLGVAAIMGSGILVWMKQAVGAPRAAMATVPCLLVSPSLNWALGK